MKIYISLLILIGLLSCNYDDKGESSLKGLWCDDSNFCVYFTSDKCILDKAVFSNYILKKEKLYINTETNKLSTYQVELTNDTLNIQRIKSKKRRKFTKSSKINSLEIEEFYYSQVSEFSEFDCFIDKKNHYYLDIKFHPDFEARKFKGIISNDLKKLLLVLLRQMDLEIKDELSPLIVSDVQEWAVKVVNQKHKEYNLYYNYLGINNSHYHFSKLMDLFPHFVELKKGEFGNKLEEIRQFRKKEFERNLKEKDHRLEIKMQKKYR